VLPEKTGKITPDSYSEIFDGSTSVEGLVKFGNCLDMDYHIDSYAQGMEMIRDEGVRALIQEFNQQLEGLEDD
jgi:hypothetical protein